jgi:hypothetical protein
MMWHAVAWVGGVAVQSTDGATPFHLACYGESFGVVARLLDRGADINQALVRIRASVVVHYGPAVTWANEHVYWRSHHVV